jgi:hypothetical protein
MLITLRACLLVVGVSAVLIALSILILGAGATAATAERLFSIVFHRTYSSELWPPTMDSELRFYAALWGAYGVVVLRTAIKLPNKLQEAPWLISVFFAGGIGRALSLLEVGKPHPFFILLMWIELLLPMLVIALWFGARAQQRSA